MVKKPKHVLVCLRKIAGLTQEQLAGMVGCSMETIRSIEAGPKRLKLSERLAERIAFETGISYTWLLKNDLAAPPVLGNGAPFTVMEYHMHRSIRTGPPTRLHDYHEYLHQAHLITRSLATLLFKAWANGRVRIAAYRIQEALDDIARDLKIDLAAETRLLEKETRLSELAGAVVNDLFDAQVTGYTKAGQSIMKSQTTPPPDPASPAPGSAG